ncbi:hypothetical protein V499_02112 [Pseudogymnoascus sp. VKM F-103]|uniref:S-adenosylmethionine-dependent methyltransferase n=1 Tax=Pseudogymnoascus verrucosus TaxID=342668 RepID=A0A1B8GTX2_9PEZI|nr:uncharacterized protein VE01_02535 [Pseudogymnoascus verrucosus]KFY78796.1 hypothetical protein V499_02112 [Pseudogymnoascus sp. VKM F-103]OBT99273.1 hypothetical protein VE01_02535 [Pseudogymnoascus verrucosus]
MLIRETEHARQNGEPINVFDLPQLYTKPSSLVLLSALVSLKPKPISWEESDVDHDQPREDNNAIASYLTKIVSSPLTWLTEGEQVEVWEQASIRLSERSGRNGMPAQTRTFNIPTTPPTSLAIHEPTMTNDNIGFKTWGTALILAQKVLPHIPTYLPHLFPSSLAAPSVLELGAGTGLLGLAAAALWGTEVVMTDLPAIVPNLERNVVANEGAIGEHGGSAKTDILDWSCMGPGQRYDLVIAADPLYDPEHPMWLAAAIDGRLGQDEGARAVIGFPLRDETTRGYGEVLRTELGGRGFEIVKEGEEMGFDDWEVNGERVRVHCWWGIWKRKGAEA